MMACCGHKETRVASSSEGAILDTIAQLGTKVSKTQKSYQRKARSRAMTLTLVNKLLKVENSSLKKSYYRSLTCAMYLYQDGDKVTSKYCNGRWCFTCNRIRTMKLIKGYSAPINEMVEPVFMTLTLPSVYGFELREKMDAMSKGFAKIVTRIRKRKSRGRSEIKVVAIRKMECNYNPLKETYNPHFHILVDGMNVAEKLLEEWLKDHPSANVKAQDLRLADKETVANELFKYFTKIVTKSGFDAVKQNVIFEAMHKRRTFQTYGGIRKVSEDVEEIQSRKIDFKESRREVWKWENSIYDWITSEGEIFSNYEPTPGDLHLIKTLTYNQKSKIQLYAKKDDKQIWETPP